MNSSSEYYGVDFSTIISYKISGRAEKYLMSDSIHNILRKALGRSVLQQ